MQDKPNDDRPPHLIIPNEAISNGRSHSGSGSSRSHTGSAIGSQLDRSPLSPASARGSIRRKLVVVGDGACGKTSLLVAYKDDKFTRDYVPTVFETSTTSVPVEDKVVELSLWDTAGQEDYDRLRPLSYPDSHVILICFAIDKPDSLTSVQRKWMYELQQYCPNVPRILVGCKSDLRRDVPPADLTTSDMGQVTAERIEAVCYVECSALTRENVNQLFAQAARVSLTYQKWRKSSSKSTIAGARSRKKYCSLQ